jgi:hypothetical protein
MLPLSPLRSISLQRGILRKSKPRGIGTRRMEAFEDIPRMKMKSMRPKILG